MVVDGSAPSAPHRPPRPPAPVDRPARRIALASTLRRWARRRASTLTWLIVAVGLGAPTGASAPRTGIDGSWVSAINIAAADHRVFGREIAFTFGPWGFLERPMIVNNPRFLLGVLFVVAAATAIFCAVNACLTRIWSPAVAGAASALVTVATSATAAGLQIVCAGSIFAFLVLEERCRKPISGWRGALPATAVAASAALLLQVKFSEGIALLALAGILVVFVSSWRGFAWNAGASAAAFLVTLVVTWLAARQPLTGVLPWLRQSWELAQGYQEAMAVERSDNVVGYVLATVLAVVAIALSITRTRAHRGAEAIGLTVVVVTVLEFGFKHGFTRHDAGHEPTFFVLAAGIIIALAARSKRPTGMVIAAALALATVPDGIGQFDPFAARDRWRTSAEAILNDTYRAQRLLEAKVRARAEYQLPAEMVAAAQGHPVSVDMWETTLPWAYSFTWNPVPVFQSYSAYTAALDELNARAVVEAPPDQIVLRENREPIDKRNAQWETPRYLLALACHYTQDIANGRWSLLRHSGNHCSEPRTILSQQVAAGEPVQVPQVGAGKMVVARFRPEPAGLIARLARTVLKDWTPMTVTVDGHGYRIPEALASGPLIVSFPDSLDWAAPFDRLHYQRMTFDRPGQLEFQVVTVD